MQPRDPTPETKGRIVTAHFNRLSPAEAEALALLAEECGEVIQCITKILRHGLYSCHPDGGENNKVMLGQEVGDLLAATEIAKSNGVVLGEEVTQAADRKLKSVVQYLHHAEVPSSSLGESGSGEP